MKAIITTFGTRGDFEPFIALAEELAAHGHEPIFAIPPFAVDMLRQTSFEHVEIAPEMPDLRDQVNMIWSTQVDSYALGNQVLERLSKLRSFFPAALEGLIDVCSGASVLVSGPAQPLARIVHDLTGIPFVSVQVSHFGGNGGPALSDIGDKLVNSFRRELGLAEVKCPFTNGANSPQLALYAMSSHVRKRSAEWPKHQHLTGYFFRPRPPLPDRSLTEFLDAGPSPVAISFGSMPHDRPHQLKAMVLKAIELCGCRAVLQGFNPGPGEDHSTSHIYWGGIIPHSYLFPRSACVVTHGGAGTAAALFRAGVPGIFVPHGDVYDQRYWAQLAQELSCSVGAIPYQELTVEKIAEAIQISLADPSFRAAAQTLAQRINREHGVQTARQLIEELIGNIGLELPLEETA